METKGRVAVITGAGSGIGRATAERLASEGAAVVIADLDPKTGQETAGRIIVGGGRAIFVQADVTDANQARIMCETALSNFGRFDILHNNAGVAMAPPGYPEAAIERWRRVLEIDLSATILGCHVAAALMKDRGGAIVNTASMAGLYPYPLDPIYAAAKAAVVNFTYSLAPWASTRNIRVNAVCPGIVDTPMVRELSIVQQAAGLKARLPERMITPEEIADAVVWLISDDSLFGRAVEIRPSGRRLVDTPQAPRRARISDS